MIESKSVNKGRRTQDFIAKACNLHLTQTLSTLLLIRLDLARMPAKKKGHHLEASLQLLGFTHPNLNERNPTDKMWLPTPHTVTRSLGSSTRCRFPFSCKVCKARWNQSHSRLANGRTTWKCPCIMHQSSWEVHLHQLIRVSLINQWILPPISLHTINAKNLLIAHPHLVEAHESDPQCNINIWV